MAILLLVSWPQLLLLLIVSDLLARISYLSVSFCLWDWLTLKPGLREINALDGDGTDLSKDFSDLLTW